MIKELETIKCVPEHGYIRDAIILVPGIELSVQASDVHYCEPRIRGLQLDMYNKVEIQLWVPVPYGNSRLIETDDTKAGWPSMIDINGFDHWWGRWPDTPCGWIPLTEVEKLIIAIKDKYAKTI